MPETTPGATTVARTVTTKTPPGSPGAPEPLPDHALRVFRAAGVLRPLDVQFARALARLSGDASAALLLGAAMASRAPGWQHVCADLTTLAGSVRLERTEGPAPVLPWPDPGPWREALAASPAVDVVDPEGATPPVDQDNAPRPLVLAGDRLYLRRYWSYQERLVGQLLRRVEARPRAIDAGLLAGGLMRLFPGVGPDDDQRRAAALAVERGFCVISGGPGTGKTTTVRKILVLLLEQALGAAAAGTDGGTLATRVLLLAPTGKAAARMKEALLDGLDQLPGVDEAVLEALPRQALTLHRALGYQPRTPTRFRHDADDPLPVDIVVVDEASMVDLAMMAKLFEAVPPHARLVLLGDADQLASVEAGAVLGDICAAGPPDALVQLRRAWRFGPQSGIGALSRAVNAGDADRALGYLRHQATEDMAVAGAAYGDLGFIELASDDYEGIQGTLDRVVRPAVLGELQAYFEAVIRDAPPPVVLDLLSRFRVLCAHRRGQLGVHGLNQAIERWLLAGGWIPRPLPGEGDERWYPGRPLLVTRNDYQLELFNGDVGYIAQGATADRATAIFPDASETGYRAIRASRLPPHETVFAMTVHKSQGSQLEHAMLVLPAAPSAIVTRELLYTGITRARRRVTVVGRDVVLRQGALERVERASGLRERLARATPDAAAQHSRQDPT